MIAPRDAREKINSDAQIRPQELNYIKEKRTLVRFNPNNKKKGNKRKKICSFQGRLTLRREECKKKERRGGRRGEEVCRGADGSEEEKRGDYQKEDKPFKGGASQRQVLAGCKDASS